MKTITAARIAQSIQLLNLDGYGEYTNRQLADASGVSTKTISRNKDLIDALDFSINRGGYHRCDMTKLA